MPTYLISPPPFDRRMDFMDALEQSGIDYSREREGYLIYLKEAQLKTWEVIASEFETQFLEEDPTSEFGFIP
jgi:hypothetical protein